MERWLRGFVLAILCGFVLLSWPPGLRSFQEPRNFHQSSATSQVRRDTEAQAKAHELIQGYLDPDHKVIDMASFYSALLQALKAAREQGYADPKAGTSDSP